MTSNPACFSGLRRRTRKKSDPRAELVQQLLSTRTNVHNELRNSPVDAERVLFKEPTIPPEVAECEEPVNMEELVSDVTLARLNEMEFGKIGEGRVYRWTRWHIQFPQSP